MGGRWIIIPEDAQGVIVGSFKADLTVVGNRLEHIDIDTCGELHD